MAKVNLGLEVSSGIHVAAGVLVVGVAYDQTVSNTTAPFLTGAIGGALLIALGVYTAWAAATDRDRSIPGVSIATGLMGLGLTGYPWLANVTPTYQYAISAAGFVVACVSAYELYWANRNKMPLPRPPTA